MKKIPFGIINYKELITLQDNPYYGELIEDIFKDGLVIGELETQFNLQEDFTRNDIISLLYYFGFLTIQFIQYHDRIKVY